MGLHHLVVNMATGNKGLHVDAIKRSYVLTLRGDGPRGSGYRGCSRNVLGLRGRPQENLQSPLSRENMALGIL